MNDNEIIRTNNGKLGGMLKEGKKHTEGGMPVIITNAGNKPIEVEVGEVIITAPAVTDDIEHIFDGKKMSNKAILSAINEQSGGVKIFGKGGDVMFEKGGRLGEEEYFSLYGHEFDIAKAYALINAGTIPKNICTVAAHNPQSNLIKIDSDYAMAKEVDWNKPSGIIVKTKKYTLLIDGNHAMYKAWKQGRKNMLVYCIEGSDYINQFYDKGIMKEAIFGGGGGVGDTSGITQRIKALELSLRYETDPAKQALINSKLETLKKKDSPDPSGMTVDINAIAKEINERSLKDKKLIDLRVAEMRKTNPKKQKTLELAIKKEVKEKAIADQRISGYRDSIIQWAKTPENDVKIIVAFSGGKDSIAMVLYLFKLGFKKDQIELWHHDVDGHGKELWDWHCTPSYCIAFAKAFDLKILFSYAKGGITREIYRNNETIQPIYFQDEMGGEFVEVLPEDMKLFAWVTKAEDDTKEYPPTDIKTVKDGVVKVKYWYTDEELRENNTRYKFPSVEANLAKRWCSWIAKISIMSKAINNSKRLKKANILVLTGETREESDTRALYLEVEPHRSHSYGAGRKVMIWRAIADWLEIEHVWDIIKEYKVQPHPCYELGWNRCSCQLCIFGRENAWASIQQISPDKVKKIAEIEAKIQFPLYNVERKIDTGEIHQKGVKKGMPIMEGTGEKLSIYEAMVNKGTSFISEKNMLRWKDEALGEFTSPIIVEDWKLPAGAGKKGQGGGAT